jgi:hypothetical protein
MSFFKNLGKVISAVSALSGNKQTANSFAFMDEGKDPVKDSQNRIIVSLSGGTQIEHEINLFSYEDAWRELMGRPSDDFESKRVRVRLILNPEGQGAQAIDIETLKGNKVGRFDKDEVSRPLAIFTNLSEYFKQIDERLVGPFAFEVAAEIEGSWDFIEDDEDSPKPYWEPSLDSLVLKIKDPLTFDIKSEKSNV